MSIQDLGAIGELLAAIATLATLIYLAVQIRQNTKAIKGSTLNSITQHKQFEIRWSGEIGEAYRKSIDDPSSLNPVEEFLMTDWLIASLIARENEYYQYREGLLDEDNWQSSEKAIRVVLGTVWAKNWWHQFSGITLGDTFVNYVNENHIDSLTDYAGALSRVHIQNEDTRDA